MGHGPILSVPVSLTDGTHGRAAAVDAGLLAPPEAVSKRIPWIRNGVTGP